MTPKQQAAIKKELQRQKAFLKAKMQRERGIKRATAKFNAAFEDWFDRVGYFAVLPKLISKARATA